MRVCGTQTCSPGITFLKEMVRQIQFASTNMRGGQRICQTRGNVSQQTHKERQTAHEKGLFLPKRRSRAARRVMVAALYIIMSASAAAVAPTMTHRVRLTRSCLHAGTRTRASAAFSATKNKQT